MLVMGVKSIIVLLLHRKLLYVPQLLILVPLAIDSVQPHALSVRSYAAIVVIRDAVLRLSPLLR